MIDLLGKSMRVGGTMKRGTPLLVLWLVQFWD
jgi:hypothetical protein